MSGFYNNWFKVQHPNVSNDIPQMKSGEFQAPFYFGGSQVPHTLGLDTNKLKGKGIDDYSKMNFQTVNRGKVSQTTNHHKATNIHLPRKYI